MRRVVHDDDTRRTPAGSGDRRTDDERQDDVALVSVRYWAGAREAAGAETETVDAGSTDALVALLSARGAGLAAVVGRSSLLVDGLVARSDVPLRDGQVVEVLPPFAGG